MKKMPVYLDHNATTPVRPEAIRAMAATMERVGNPSSVHGFGRAARRILEDARDALAALVEAPGSALTFTSGGTEANNLALRGTDARSVLVSAVEHPSVMEAIPKAQIIPVGSDGVVDLDALDGLLADAPKPALVSVMLANNETGVIQPIAEVVEIARRHGARVHCDAVQALGKIAVDFTGLGVDMMSVSAHKIGGPQGVGALILRDGVSVQPLMRGGGQERRRRGGTENLPGVAGFGTAAEMAAGALVEYGALATHRDRLERDLGRLTNDLTVFGVAAPRLPNTTCCAVAGLASEILVPALDLEGIAISAGSACSSGKVQASPVLEAMGQGPWAGNAVRISLGWTSRTEDVDRFLSAWTRIAERALGREGVS